MAILRNNQGGHSGRSPEGVEERLAALEGAEAARVALASYCSAVDAQDLVGVSALLDRAVVLSIGDMTVNGYDDVVKFFRSAFADDQSRKSHFVTNVAPRWLGGDVVHVDAYFLWTAGTDSQSIIGWGTYSDRVKVVDGAGKFTSIEIAIRHMGDIDDGWMFGSATG
jgi:ketosteroid isomerase-like protein